MSQTKHKNDRFKTLHGDTTRTDYAKQKRESKPKKTPKFASDKTKARKLEEKAIKREKYITKHKNENRRTNK